MYKKHLTINEMHFTHSYHIHCGILKYSIPGAYMYIYCILRNVCTCIVYSLIYKMYIRMSDLFL